MSVDIKEAAGPQHTLSALHTLNHMHISRCQDDVREKRFINGLCFSPEWQWPHVSVWNVLENGFIIYINKETWLIGMEGVDLQRFFTSLFWTSSALWLFCVLGFKKKLWLIWSCFISGVSLNKLEQRNCVAVFLFFNVFFQLVHMSFSIVSSFPFTSSN